MGSGSEFHFARHPFVGLLAGCRKRGGNGVGAHHGFVGIHGYGVERLDLQAPVAVGNLVLHNLGRSEDRLAYAYGIGKLWGGLVLLIAGMWHSMARHGA